MITFFIFFVLLLIVFFSLLRHAHVHVFLLQLPFFAQLQLVRVAGVWHLRAVIGSFIIRSYGLISINTLLLTAL